MAIRSVSIIRNVVIAIVLLVCSEALTRIEPVVAQPAAPLQYGVAAKRPVLQAACRYCPWGALGDVLKTAMEPLGYDVVLCESCSGENGTRIVSRRLFPPEVSDRQFAEGTPLQPLAQIDFGVTNSEN